MLLHHQSHLPQFTLFALPPSPPPPKKKLWLALFSISLGTAVKPSRNEKKNKGDTKFWGANKVHYGRCAMAYVLPYSIRNSTSVSSFRLYECYCLGFKSTHYVTFNKSIKEIVN